MTYRSDEERNFAAFLDEAVVADLVTMYEYEPEEFIVCEKTLKPNGKMAFQKAKYTPDFKVWLTPRGELAFPQWMKHAKEDDMGDTYVWLEIKGEFDHFRKDDRYVKLKIKLVYERHGEYVIFTKLPSFFKETWLPAPMWLTKTGKSANNKTTKACLTINQFCARIQGKQEELKL